MKAKVKIYVSSFRIASSQVDKAKVCSQCGPQHTGRIISQQLTHFHDSTCFLSEDQTKIVDTTVEICEENGLEYEIVDIENLGFLSKMKLFFKGIRAPTVTFEGKTIEGMPTREDLKA